MVLLSELYHIMNLMVCIFLSIVGFIFLFLYDFCQLWKKKHLTLLFSIIGYGSIGASFFFLFFWYPLRETPLWILLFSTILLGICFCLLLFSQFIELSYGKAFENARGRRVFRKGTYGIVRHPGFWWFFFMVLFLNGAFRQGQVICLSVLQVFLNLCLIILEDRLIFPRIFVDYDEYIREIPFLIPRLKKATEEI